MTDFTLQPLRVDALDGFHRVLVDAARLPFGYSVCFAADVRWLFLHRWRAALLDAGFRVLSGPIPKSPRVNWSRITECTPLVYHAGENRNRYELTAQSCFDYGFRDWSFEGLNRGRRSEVFNRPAGFLDVEPWCLGNFAVMLGGEVDGDLPAPLDITICGTSKTSITKGRTVYALLGVRFAREKISSEAVMEIESFSACRGWLPCYWPFWISSAYFTKFMQYYCADGCQQEDEPALRKRFGFPEKGNAGISEEILFREVCMIFGTENVKRRYRGKELGGLEIDVWVPSLSIGFEYQGEQHFKHISHWHGENGFSAQKERDLRKRKRCRELGYRIIFVEPGDDMRRETLLRKMREQEWIMPTVDFHSLERYTGNKVDG